MRNLIGILCAVAELVIVIDHAHHIAEAAFFRKPFTVVNAEDPHALMIVEVGKKLRRNKEVLRAVLFAGHVDHGVVDVPFGSLIHTLKSDGESRSR